ncbi:MAG: signal peptidase I [Planctomycetia bacterium]|jgi:signal peptidase I
MSKNKKRSSGSQRPKTSSSHREKADASRKPSGGDSKSKKKVGKHSHFSFGSFRELMESIAIAFVLAFLFRTFEAEAFVIPTGSMATTLMGHHKDVVCPQCGCPYTVSASEEIDSMTGEVQYQGRVSQATCPMCRFRQMVSQEQSYNGDRILVSKFDYQLHKPDRWDVTVFMYPNDAKTNYIKRLVGLPNETVKIHRGDLFIKKDGESDFKIARKPPDKYLAMARVVYDNDYALPETLIEYGWPRRWQSPDTTAAWEESEDYRSFSTDGTNDRDVVLRYYHFLPGTWEQNAVSQNIAPQLITDDCAYNSGESANVAGNGLGLHWVGDLGVECRLDVRKASGSMVFELIEGGRRMLCEIDLSTGMAHLTILGDTFTATGQTSILQPGSYRIRFVNADDQLRLWVNDKVIAFDKPTVFGPLNNKIPTEADWQPVAIVSRKADVTVSHLRVLRDIYYIADNEENREQNHNRGPITDFKNFGRSIGNDSEEALRRFYQSSERWPEAFSEESMRAIQFPLKEKQYFMLGDNSPQSKDSRLWEPAEKYYVPEELLKGKAMFIYWPHSWDKVQIGDVEIPFPFFPNYERMHLVR